MKPVQIRSTVADKARQTERGPREVDPNRLSYPGFRLNDIKQLPYSRKVADAKTGRANRATEKLRFRPLYEHQTKCPGGVVQEIKFKVPVRGSQKPLYVVSPVTVGGYCPYVKLIGDVDKKYQEDPKFRDFYETINLELLKWSPKDGTPAPDPIALRNAEFLSQYMAFTNTWNTFWIPGIMWAECEEKMGFGSKYADLVNYKPNTKQVMTRLLELGDWTMTHQLMEALQPPTEEQLAACMDENGEPLEGVDPPVQINSKDSGLPVLISRQITGESGEGRVSYHFEPVIGRPSPLPKDIQAKLDMRDEKGEDTNYPDVVKWKVLNRLSSPEDMILKLLNSSMGDVLVEWGLISTGTVEDSPAPAAEEGNTEDDGDVPV